VPTYNARTWTLAKRNKSKMKALDRRFLKNTEGKARREYNCLAI
jgi:hypothetical protein